MPKHSALPVFIVSDGTCRTCDQVVKAALAQFEGQPVEVVLKKNVRTKKAAVKAVREAAKAGAVLFHTLVSEENRVALRSMAEELFVPTCDVLGPTISALNSVLHSAPTARPGLLYENEKAYFDRIDAIDYTLKHDDGVRTHDLNRADVILVGVSRVSKSSTCFYLAYRGIRAANVPLIMGHDPPEELLDADPTKVIGLAANVHRLQSVRQARLHSIGADGVDHYTDRGTVAKEVRAANALMKKKGWRRIDVSYRAIEEVAREVMRLLGTEHLNIDDIDEPEEK